MQRFLSAKPIKLQEGERIIFAEVAAVRSLRFLGLMGTLTLTTQRICFRPVRWSRISPMYWFLKEKMVDIELDQATRVDTRSWWRSLYRGAGLPCARFLYITTADNREHVFQLQLADHAARRIWTLVPRISPQPPG